MTALHPLFRRHHRLALWLAVAALAMKMLVPAGYMIGFAKGVPTIELCSGFAAPPTAAAMPMHAMPGMTHHAEGKDGHGKAEAPCPFAALTTPSLAAADAVLLAAALLYLVATVFRIADRARSPKAPAFLRPPPRAPPAHR